MGVKHWVIQIILVCLAVSIGWTAEGKPRIDKATAKLFEKWEGIAFDVNTVRKLGGEKQWRPYDGNPIIRPGAPGEWDAGALGSMSAMKVGDGYPLYYGPQGHFNAKDGDIRVAIYSGSLDDLAARK